MWLERVSNPGPLTYESGALPTALRGSANIERNARTLRHFSKDYFEVDVGRSTC